MTTTDNEPVFTPTDTSALLDIWFDTYSLTILGTADESTVRRWFLHTPELAQRCAVFKPLLTLLSTTFTPTTIPSLATSPRTTLALIILLSQIPRVLSPDSGEIYSLYDPLAHAVAEYALEAGRRLDLGVGGEWRRVPAVRMWFLLPGGNSRDLGVLETTVQRGGELVRDLEGVVGGVWDGRLVGEGVNLKRFLEGRRDERRAGMGL